MRHTFLILLSVWLCGCNPRTESATPAPRDPPPSSVPSGTGAKQGAAAAGGAGARTAGDGGRAGLGSSGGSGRKTAAAESSLAALWVRHADHEEPFWVSQPFAVYVDWPEQFFIVYRRDEKRVQRTSDFDLFIANLKALPRGQELQRIETRCGACLVGMPEGRWAQLGAALKEGGHRWAINPADDSERWNACSCQSEGFRFPEASEAGAGKP